MNRNEFQQAAKKFRAGRLTLEDFANRVFDQQPDTDQDPKNQDRPANVAPLPSRPLNAHKGDFGRILVLGGSDSMSGAIKLTGLAALRSGSGLVIVGTPDTEQVSVESFSPCYMTIGFDEAKGRFSKDAVDSILDQCQWADVVAIGPGMGQSKHLQRLMGEVYSRLPQPVVIDADGLNNLANSDCDLTQHEGLRVLTPHPGEFQRLLDTQITDRQELEKQAIEFAARCDLTVVLKGHQTLVTDGSQHYHNDTGNPGMATAGSGDVLTGVVASFIGQGLAPYDAASAAVRVHGRAGDIAAIHFGQVSLVSTDVLDCLADAIMGTK